MATTNDTHAGIVPGGGDSTKGMIIAGAAVGAMLESDDWAERSPTATECRAEGRTVARSG